MSGSLRSPAILRMVLSNGLTLNFVNLSHSKHLAIALLLTHDKILSGSIDSQSELLKSHYVNVTK